jgi:hypothetical protein
VLWLDVHWLDAYWLDAIEQCGSTLLQLKIDTGGDNNNHGGDNNHRVKNYDNKKPDS